MPAPFVCAEPANLTGACRARHLPRVIDPQLAAAAVESEAALARGTGDAHDHTVAALARAARGDQTGAQALLERALAMEPGNPATLTGLAIFHRQNGRLREAVLACDAAIAAWPDYPDAWLERGAILSSGGSAEAARKSFARAAELAPQSAPAHAGLAALAAREGNVGDARLHAEQALALDPGNIVAATALARADIAAGQSERARDLLAPRAAAMTKPNFDRMLTLVTLGDALDRLKDHAGAYAAYARSKADFAAIHADTAAGRMRHGEFIEAIAQGFAAVDPWPGAVCASPRAETPRHVFLLGYPRSGTTLLENVLATLPGVAALEERPTLAAADREYLSGSHGEVVASLARFARLDGPALDDLSRAYWEKVADAGVPNGAACFVDMDPLKGTRLPLIARLFPDARILIMRRDPRDVVWSCFRTNFAMTSGTLDYTSLESTARHYDALMRLTQSCLDRLPLNVHEVHYHCLVRDFDSTTREICDFLGLEWTADLRRFDRTAARRGVTTASAGQVQRGLYDGPRQWEPYAQFFAPVMPMLQPWIDRFGYS